MNNICVCVLRLLVYASVFNNMKRVCTRSLIFVHEKSNEFYIKQNAHHKMKQKERGAGGNGAEWRVSGLEREMEHNILKQTHNTTIIHNCLSKTKNYYCFILHNKCLNNKYITDFEPNMMIK